jgi:hypothetical protein
MQTLMRQSLGFWRESATLIALRDALLPKLVSEEIRIPDSSDSAEASEIAVEVV